jgi:quinol-cytochrome oxidoreductase complex cytochrome b subunit
MRLIKKWATGSSAASARHADPGDDGASGPAQTASWAYVFGSAALTCSCSSSSPEFCSPSFTCPPPGEAWNSLQILNHQVTLGWFIRALHGWGSNFMVAIVLIHMVQVFLFGAYKFPRELTWMVGVLLLLLTLGMAFTGQVLRFDQDAYWGLGIGASISSRIPVLGPWIVKPLAGRADHRRRHAFAVLRAARVRDPGIADCVSSACICSWC